VIVVVLPVSRSYEQEFLDKRASDNFERALDEDMKMAPEAMLVRLDRVPGIDDDGYFSDLVHLNADGRRMTTPVFLKKVSESISNRKSNLDMTDLVPGSNGFHESTTAPGIVRQRASAAPFGH
jgi:hypothetical protein